MITSLSNLRFPQILHTDTHFLHNIRVQLLKRMKRKLYGQRRKEYDRNENLTTVLRNSLPPNLFEDVLAICNAEHLAQTRLTSHIHRAKLYRWSQRRQVLHSSSSPSINQFLTSTTSSTQEMSQDQDTSGSSLQYSSRSENSRITFIPPSPHSIQNLPPAMISLLKKGPKFVPSLNRVDDNVLLQFNLGFQRLIHQVRWYESSEQYQRYGEKFIRNPNFQEVTRPPIASATETKIRKASLSYHSILTRISNNKIARNLTRAEWCVVRSLKHSTFRILPSDKGGDLCLCDGTIYRNAVLEHLADTSTYRRISFIDSVKVEERVNKVWKGICKQRKIWKAVELMFCSSASRISTFKGLIKTHKGLEHLQIRPVINTINSPTYKISWVLHKILQKALPRPENSWKDSNSIIEDILNRRSYSHVDHVYPFSLDVKSMYPSIPALQAVDYFCRKLAEANFTYCGLTPADFRTLFKIVLDNSYFQFDKIFYKQMRGLPIGDKISGLLADYYMDMIERPLIRSLHISFYYRYVDDCLIISTSRDDAMNVHNTFNMADENIKFDIEYPQLDGSLSLLDFKINVRSELPTLSAYTKEVKSNIFITNDTAIPTCWKRRIIMNEWRRLRNRCSTAEEKRETREKFIRKLKFNGHEQIPFLSLDNHPNAAYPGEDRKVFYLSIPFISDAVNRRIQKSVKDLGHNVRITHKSVNLSNILYKPILHPPTRNANCNLNGCKINDAKLCFKSMVVYEAKCTRCRESYIGSTKKFFHTRIHQHFHQRTSQIYQHNSICKGQWTFKLRWRENSLQSLRWAEAILLKKEKPGLNRREEGGLMSFLV
jgi:hypothetical protein